MRNLFLFFYRIRFFLLFLALEAIAFSWIQRSRSYQRSVMLNSANAVTGSILEQTGSVEEYLELAKQNERLARENARLRSLTDQAYFPLTVSSSERVDTTYQVRYNFQEGEVISSSFRKARNYMTIDRGSVHGLQSGMGVIGPEGVAGVVNDVSRHFSTVIPVINPSFSVSGAIKNKGYFGPVLWKNGDFRFAYLTDIPRYAEVEEGDTVITDSRSLVFPQGVPIGYVESYELQEDQNFYQVKLRLATDFASLNHIYVIEDKMKMEVENLQDQQEQQ